MEWFQARIAYHKFLYGIYMMTIEKFCLWNNDWQRDIVFSCYISYFIEWSFYKSSYCMHVFVSIVVPLVMSPWGYHHDPDNPLLVLYFKNKSSRSSQENKMLPEKNIFVVLMMQPKIDHKNLRFYSPCSI